jgi:ElaB/YqjD/DUF883 family membrane-anchored ribosome-binding protein
MTHEAQLLKSRAADALEDGAYAVKRAITSITRRVEALGDLKEEAAHRVRRQPLKSVGLAIGAGLALGLAVGWFGGRFGRRASRPSDLSPRR